MSSGLPVSRSQINVPERLWRLDAQSSHPICRTGEVDTGSLMARRKRNRLDGLAGNPRRTPRRDGLAPLRPKPALGVAARSAADWFVGQNASANVLRGQEELRQKKRRTATRSEDLISAHGYIAEPLLIATMRMGGRHATIRTRGACFG